MESLFTRILRPVKRQGAERYLRLTLLAFAMSVVLTRLFLSLTGYPQVGSGTLHIAHLLWGGLFLFVASLLPLMFANRWVYQAGGVLSGIGVGLFVDEVGKFITRTNDYFYPGAAPIIYGFFLLVVLLYLRVGRPSPADPRAELYRVFDDMSEVLDRDLDSRERADLEARLRRVARDAGNPDYADLALVLEQFLASDTACQVNPVPGRLGRWLERGRALESRLLTRGRFRLILGAGLLALGLFSLVQLSVLALAAVSPASVSNEARAATGLPVVTPAPGQAGHEAAVGSEGSAGDEAGAENPAAGPVRPAARTFRSLVAFWLRAGLEALSGALLVVAAVFLALRRERPGVLLGSYTLLLALTCINVLVFYFDQFAAVADAILQFGLYQALAHYRHRYLSKLEG